MALKNIKILLVIGALSAGPAFAQDVDYLTVESVQVSKIQTDVLNQEISEIMMEKQMERDALLELPGMPNKLGQVTTANVGKVISIGKELVALGEDIYKLIQKGKPVIKTSYAPISVIPRSGNASVDIFETENWKMPKTTTYQIIYKNVYGMEVVKFRYSVIFTYGGTYQGKGAYITAAQIVPGSITTLWGYTFSATMKLNGIQNHGTKVDPLAGAILAMEYTVETVVQASLTTDSFHLTGRGGFKKL